MNPIDKLTMEYMSNKMFNEYVEQNKDEYKIQYEKDERFYKKRLYVLYKELFKSKSSLDKSVIHYFEKFNSVAIEYLKQQDTQEIVQTQLGNLPLEKKVGFDETIPLDSSPNPSSEVDQQRDLEAFQNGNNVKTCTLDNFIIRKPIQKKDPKPPPQQIHVILKTKDLQNKNVPKKKKKKNINNKYEESQEKTSGETTTT